MTYRIAAEPDLLQLAHLRWDFRSEDGEIPIVDKNSFIDSCLLFLQGAMKSGRYTVWVADENGEIAAHIFVATVDLVPRPCKIQDQFGYVTNTYTKPAYRNRGVGSALLQRVARWATEKDLELLLTYPSEEAIPFYERAGFKSENDVMELRLRAYE